MPLPVQSQGAQGLDSRMAPTFGFGIASPCSTCKNRRALPDKDGKPACPRIAVQQRQIDAQTNGTDFTSFDHLTLTGLEANPFATSSPGVLANPVYDEGRQSIYIWVARVVDNPGSLNPDGTVQCPPITDPSFLTDYTDYIQCMSMPMIPADTLAQYYTKGRISEGDSLLITSFQGQQTDSNGQSEVFGGVASKLSLHRDFPITSRPAKDDHPRGT